MASTFTDIVIIGAGPYGLSLAAHLRPLGIPCRVFGQVMSNWRHKMPRGMLLKSDPYASNLSDPARSMALKNFCLAEGIPYADEEIRVSSETFIAYGDAFQRRFVPNLEDRRVVSLDRNADGFTVGLDDGETVRARKVVVAIGISDFPYVPPVLADLPRDLVSHPAQHADMEAFRGREVAIVGAGSSAVDLAALLHEGGAAVQLIARRPQLRFHDRAVLGDGRSIVERLRAPNTGIGPGWRNVLYTRAPQLFRHLPDDLRLRIVSNEHGPAGGWFMRDRVVGKVPILSGFAPQGAEIRDGRVNLRLVGQDGGERTVSADHVIAATGYKVDLRAVGFLGEGLRRSIGLLGTAPRLSAQFETTVPGLYVIGPAAAFSFGPMFRFVLGTEYTAPFLARHLAHSGARRDRPRVGAGVPVSQG